MRVKNWDKFQHFKDRTPPWIKLYRDLLDDLEWHELDATAAKALVSIWIIASENRGELPDMKTLAFRLRKTETQTKTIISSLSHWLEQVDINSISTLPLEGETERETEGETDRGFTAFWFAYPNKAAKEKARQAFAKALRHADLQTILAGLEAHKTSAQWVKDGGRFIPHPATWLNNHRWADEGVDANAQARNVIEEAERMAFGAK